MVNKNGEINALLNLIEDPDEEVYHSITKRFVGFGQAVIPVLSEFQQLTEDPVQVNKIASIISTISIDCLETAVLAWKNNHDHSVVEASVFIATYLNPDNERDSLFFEIEKIRKTIWLELNDYLTPLEEINVFNKIIYGHYNFRGLKLDQGSIADFDMGHLFTKKSSNTFPIGSLYLILAEMLGISVMSVDIPKLNLLCYVEDDSSIISLDGSDILFYVDPLNGQIYTHKDVEQYVKKSNLVHPPVLFKSSSSINFVQRWLKKIAEAEKSNHELERYEALQRIVLSLEE